MSWLKRAVGAVIRLYLSPLRWSESTAFFASHHCFSEASEHLYRTVRMIRASNVLSTDALIVDVGAADGGTSTYLRKHFPVNPILAFEPNSRMAERLEAAARRIGNAQVRRIALGSSLRTATLHVTANNVSSSLNPISASRNTAITSAERARFVVEQTEKVEVSTLDEEVAGAREVLLLKLDTQGTELDILRGGHDILKRTRFVLVEMANHHLYECGCQYHDVDNFLREKAFRLVDLIVSYCPAAGVQEFDALYVRDAQRPLETGPGRPSRS